MALLTKSNIVPYLLAGTALSAALVTMGLLIWANSPTVLSVSAWSSITLAGAAVTGASVSLFPWLALAAIMAIPLVIAAVTLPIAFNRASNWLFPPARTNYVHTHTYAPVNNDWVSSLFRSSNRQVHRHSDAFRGHSNTHQRTESTHSHRGSRQASNYHDNFFNQPVTHDSHKSSHSNNHHGNNHTSRDSAPTPSHGYH